MKHANDTQDRAVTLQNGVTVTLRHTEDGPTLTDCMVAIARLQLAAADDFPPGPGGGEGRA